MYISLWDITVLNFPWFLLFISIHFSSLPQIENYQTKINNKAMMQRMNQNIIDPFPHYGKNVLCQCSHLTSVVVSRLWFGMLIQNALSMYRKFLNCYVNCLHMWLLYVISLYLYMYLYPNMFLLCLILLAILGWPSNSRIQSVLCCLL